ncbi:MAG: ABC transporter substrate-binding protein [Alphaproteobacteria bacterium]
MALKTKTLKTALLSAAAALLAGWTAASAQTLVLYTSQPDKDAAETTAAFSRRNPGVKVEIFRSGTTEIMNKLMAEIAAGDPKPDVLLVAASISRELLKKENRLLAHPGADVANLPAEAYDRDRTYFGTKLITSGIVYNTGAKERPTSWKDLADAKYRGQIVMPSPLYSGAAAITVSTFAARPDFGWSYIEALMKGNQATAVRGNGAVLRSVASGEKAYGILVDFMALNAKQKGSPVEFVIPAEGLTAVTEPVAILRTARNQAAARAFVDFLLSEEGQKLAVGQGYLPAHRKVAPPAGYPSVDSLRIMPMDMAGLLATIEADKKRFADSFGQ